MHCPNILTVVWMKVKLDDVDQQFWQNLTELFHTHLLVLIYWCCNRFMYTRCLQYRHINQKHVTLGTGGSNQVHWLFFFSFWSQAYSISIEDTPIWILISIYLVALVMLYKLKHCHVAAEGRQSM